MLSTNEQELLEELKERMMQYMRDEEELKAGREAKGLFKSVLRKGSQGPWSEDKHAPKKLPGDVGKDVLKKKWTKAPLGSGGRAASSVSGEGGAGPLDGPDQQPWSEPVDLYQQVPSGAGLHSEAKRNEELSK